MLSVEGVCVGYPGTEDVLHDVDLTIEPGEHVCLLGANGSGKSTLARLLNAGMRPRTGFVRVDGIDTTDSQGRREVRRRVGFVRQDPTSQLVSARVYDEVAFGPQNLGWDRDRIERAVGHVLDIVGLSALAARGVDELSGGEQQRLALAGVLVMDPNYLVLDEVTAFLDPISRLDIRDIVRDQVTRGLGVLEVTHDRAAIAGTNRAVILRGGRIAWQGTSSEVLGSHELLCASGLEDGARGGDAWESAVSVAEKGPRDVRVGIDGVTVRYGDVLALDNASLSLASGEVVLVAGRSGSGKSTLARVMAGVLEPNSGTVLVDGAPVRPGGVGLAFQHPADQLFCDTVTDDVAFGPRNLGLDEDEVARRSSRALTDVGIDEGRLGGKSPLRLSGGQARRVALAGIAALEPAAYVLDEPSAALDAGGRARLRALVSAIAHNGAPVMVVSHDLEEWLGACDRVVLMERGRIVWEGVPAELARDHAPLVSAGLARGDAKDGRRSS